MIISIDTGKYLTKFICTHDKSSQKTRNRGKLPHIDKKKIHEKPTAKTFNSEKLKAFPLR